jgi:para-nitrobenzyl esterase
MEPSVETSNGPVRGVREDDLAIFRGIPYARPPIGELRFRPPEPAAAWTILRDASAFGPTCPQPLDMVSSMLGFETQPANEDCLTVNVWTPATDGGRRPVLVWIHGGAFVVGSGSRRLTDAAALARRGDVVVVSCNYRLGAFGFLYLGERGGDGLGAVPNVGLLDQVAALEWVQREIAAFGGDPDNVTVFGESAGAVSVASLLAMPRAAGLFRRAILQSGSANLVAPPARATQIADAVLRQLRIEPDTLGDLRRVPAERLLEAQIRVLMAPPKGVGGLPFQPVIDGEALPSDPFERIRAGGAREVAMLIGTTLDEMRLFDLMDPKARELDEAALLRRCEHTLDPVQAGRALALYREQRRTRGASVSPPDLWTAVESDRLMRAPAMRLAELQAVVQPAVYAFLFTWASPYLDGRLGSCHALDIPFVFGTLDNPLIQPFAGSGPDAQRLAHQMQDAWIAFARVGDPSHAGLPGWPRYEPTRRATMLLGRECGVVEAPYDEERAFWETIG